MFGKQSQSKIISVALILAITIFSLIQLGHFDLSFSISNMPLVSSSEASIVSERYSKDNASVEPSNSPRYYQAPPASVRKNERSIEGLRVLSPDIKVKLQTGDIKPRLFGSDSTTTHNNTTIYNYGTSRE